MAQATGVWGPDPRPAIRRWMRRLGRAEQTLARIWARAPDGTQRLGDGVSLSGRCSPSQSGETPWLRCRNGRHRSPWAGVWRGDASPTEGGQTMMVQTTIRTLRSWVTAIWTTAATPSVPYRAAFSLSLIAIATLNEVACGLWVLVQPAWAREVTAPAHTESRLAPVSPKTRRRHLRNCGSQEPVHW
jgi:hypothetical protein